MRKTKKWRIMDKEDRVTTHSETRESQDLPNPALGRRGSREVGCLFRMQLTGISLPPHIWHLEHHQKELLGKELRISPGHSRAWLPHPTPPPSEKGKEL